MLEEKGADWRIEPLRPGQHKQPGHLARHPFGRMPVLTDGDFELYETQAILRYLDRALPLPPLTPADHRSAARMDQVLNINDCYVMEGCANIIVFQRIVRPRLTGLPPDEAATAAAMPRAHTVFAELSRLLGGQDWFAGDAISLADFAVGGQLDMFSLVPEWAELTAGRPNLLRWLDQLRGLASMQATTARNLTARAEAQAA